jgi:hypothetical protein
MLNGVSLFAQPLKPGDIILADQRFGRIVKIDGLTNELQTIAFLGSLAAPRGIAFDDANLDRVYVTERRFGQVIEIDTVSGAQRVISSGGMLRLPADLAIDDSGDLLVADVYSGLLKIDRVNGQQTVLVLPSYFRLFLSGIVRHPNGKFLLADYAFWPTGPGRVSQFDPSNNSISTLSANNLLRATAGIDIDWDGNVLVSNGNEIIAIDPISGDQTLFLAGSFATPGVGIDLFGDLIVSSFDGGVLRADRFTGELELIADTDFEIAGLAVMPNNFRSIAIDIKPNNSRNIVRVNSRSSIDVAVMGSQTIAVDDLDRSSIRFGVMGREAATSRVRIRDVNRDGFEDLVCRFRISETEVSSDSTRLRLSCRTTNELRLSGSDQITPR